ncbi:hypothetical protein BRSPCE3_43910 [Bradyrhizobium sp. Ce-3]|nr:hypothetical protein BRSPCE3_43910 [Bradyrhizobium sp. Ce-3]
MVQDTGPAPCSLCRAQPGARHPPESGKNPIRKAAFSFKGGCKNFWLGLARLFQPAPEPSSFNLPTKRTTGELR